jgi:hypothetical protein
LQHVTRNDICALDAIDVRSVRSAVANTAGVTDNRIAATTVAVCSSGGGDDNVGGDP